MISVCIPTYNGAAYVRAQIDSVLASPRVDELLVSDDGSTDDTLALVRKVGDPRVRLLRGPGKGLIRNYEYLLSRCAGDFIFLADQDDVWLPEKVDVMMHALQSRTLVVCDCTVTDGSLRPLNPSYFALRPPRQGVFRNLIRNSYLGCCIAMRREILEKALPFPPRIAMHDWWLGLVADAFFTTAFISRPLVLYRRHGANASSTSESSRTPLGTRIAWRANMASALAIRALRQQ